MALDIGTSLIIAADAGIVAAGLGPKAVVLAALFFASASAFGCAVMLFADGAAVAGQGGQGDDDGVEEIFEHGGEEVKEKRDLLSTL